MANLPSEIIFEILTRVPAKSLLRFRCVCKSWRSLISANPHFVKSHLHRAISDDVNVGCQRVLLPTCPFFQSIDFEALNNGGDNPSSMVLDFLVRPYDPERDIAVSVSGSCNGLVCMIIDCDKIVLCNPCTRESRELPKPSVMHPENGFLADGFGYDSSVDDYKLVIASRPTHSNGNAQMEVFSLKSNSWKRVNDIHPSISLNMGQGAFLNGSLHWIANRQGSDQLIVCFDLATEEFRELAPLPPDRGGWNYLVVLGEFLSVVCGYAQFKYEVWIMKQYGVEASWTKLFMYPINSDYMVPLCLSNNGEVLLDADGARLKMYNLEEMTCNDLDVEGHWAFSAATTYLKTLVSPIGNVED